MFLLSTILTLITNCNYHAAAKAIDVLNFTPLNGKIIRIMYSIRDPSARKSGAANVFIKVPFADSQTLFFL